MSERQASTFRKGQFTDSHIKVLAYLNQLGVSYKGEEVVHCLDNYDKEGRPISYKVDILVLDSRYEVGVIEVEGKGSKTAGNWMRDMYLLDDNGIEWIEHLPNKDISLLAVSQILARHKL